MILRLILRRNGPGVRISTDFKVESQDTPRINNLGMEIKNELDRICDECAQIKVNNKGK